MAKKNSFEKAFLDIDTQNDNGIMINNIQNIKESKENKDDIAIYKELSLNNYIQSKVLDLEEKIKNESISKFKLKKKLSYSDKYVGVTISIRPELKSIIEDLKEKTIMGKYEIIELLLITGLKSINFDE